MEKTKKRKERTMQGEGEGKCYAKREKFEKDEGGEDEERRD